MSVAVGKQAPSARRLDVVTDERTRRVPLLLEPIRKVRPTRVLDSFRELPGRLASLSGVEHAPTVIDAILASHGEPLRPYHAPRRLVLATQRGVYAERLRALVPMLRPGVDRIIVIGIAGRFAKALRELAEEQPTEVGLVEVQ